MDGAGVLFEKSRSDPCRRADGRDHLERRRCRDRDRGWPARRRSIGCDRRTSRERCSASSIGSWRRRGRPAPHVDLRLLGTVRRRSGTRRARHVPSGHLPGSSGDCRGIDEMRSSENRSSSCMLSTSGCRRRTRRRDRRQRAPRARPAARDGPRVRALRADDRRRAARTTFAVRRSGGAAGRR